MFSKRTLLIVWLIWFTLSTTLATIALWPKPTHRAVILMALGLVLLWIFGFGAINIFFAKPIAKAIRRISLHWGVRFVVTCTLLAMLEEVITVTMTNLAPVFGVKIGEAYITASANYFDVILFHSVAIFVSLFIAWTFILKRIAFTAFEGFILFGITGVLAEFSIGGPQAFVAFAFWIPIYGLMIYIPLLAESPRPTAQRPKWWHYPLAVVFPFPFVAIFPIVFVLQWLFGGIPHPQIHF